MLNFPRVKHTTVEVLYSNLIMPYCCCRSVCCILLLWQFKSGGRKPAGSWGPKMAVLATTAISSCYIVNKHITIKVHYGNLILLYHEQASSPFLFSPSSVLAFASFDC